MHTVGLSPKAYIPFIALLTAGVLLLVLGHHQEGGALIAAAVGQLGLAVAAPPGHVEPADTVAAPWPDAHGDQAGVAPNVARRERLPEDTR